jgi:hypothetical protein
VSDRVIAHPNLPTVQTRRTPTSPVTRLPRRCAVGATHTAHSWPPPRVGALPDEVEQYLEWVLIERNRPATTVRAYRQDLAKFVAFLGCHG